MSTPIPMRLAVLILLLVGAAFAQGFASVDKVYVWPMQSSFDQYLAQELAAQGAFRIVVDPKDADAILTERIDEDFLEELTEMFAAPEPEAEASDEEEVEVPAIGESIEGGNIKLRQTRSSFGRSKGNLFLVSVADCSVIWSTYLKEFYREPDKLNERAREVVQRLRKQSGATD
jgi:hypothetical protein